MLKFLFTLLLLPVLSACSPNLIQIETAQNDLSGPYFADVNADGKNDLIIGDEQGNILFIENSGTAGKPVYGKKHYFYADSNKIKLDHC